MPVDEKPKIVLKLEVSVPNLEGGPAKKFSVNRTLRARWVGDPKEATQGVLEEIKNYKGSFVGDMMVSLSSLMMNENSVNLPENKRSLDVDRWTSSLLENTLYTAVREEIFKDYIEDFIIPEWDGSAKKIEAVTSSELEKVDMDRVMLILGPKIKHVISLISKELKNNENDS